ncbi:hypothetical protein VB796_21345 [Arcicella sp. LKC2W]|uniref:hypothetical protein n=1 Tax=Arcicella sp. LKC2W TaxID=2984198 RepID=UPI002B1FC2B1|nr:hypothetical protein [Arcicella sp. LKC2W]MEA5461627.1 hypothetical protein [Arcicella sp. LKC2W]
MKTDNQNLSKTPQSPIFQDMYALTESSNSILYGLKAHYAIEANRDESSSEKRNENQQKLDEISQLTQHIYLHNTPEKLQAIINQYGPILKKINAYE